jgi:hypothetical protein
MFPPSELPYPGQLLLITDELPSPADFLLHKFLSTHLKDPKDARCVVISVSEDLARWKAIASKSVCQSLAWTHVTSRSFLCRT